MASIRWRGAIAALALASSAALVPAGARACGVDSDCAVADGSYRVWMPEAAAADRPVGALVYLHGYRGSPEEIMRFAALRSVVAELGVALIAPRGEDGSWTLPGVFGEGRDEVAFVGAVVEDAVARFPIDRGQVMVGGFSLGGSLAWYVACAEGRRYAGYVAIAGSFWMPDVGACRTPPPELRHVHGRADATVPMAGRRLSFATQGDTYRSFALLRGFAGCSAPLPPPVAEGRLACARAKCAGATQELCLHDGGHSVEPAWIARAWRDIVAGAPVGH